MKIFHLAYIILPLAAIPATAKDYNLKLTNNLDEERTDEIVELNLTDLKEAKPGKFIILDNKGNEVPYQLTHDGKLIFPVTIAASSEVTYKLKPGTPALVKPMVFGRLVPERLDDMTWENDRSAYRAYGPALQRTGERAFGYDIWTKSVPELVIDKRYDLHNNHKISFHEDHGEGMDVYAVGPTLGGGTAALLDDNGEIVYPYCYKEYEVLDNGPLRFTVKLTYDKLAVDNDTVIEQRIISLDRGSFLNRTTVKYTGLKSPKQIAPGIVIHKQNPEAYTFSTGNNYMAYSDLTQDATAGNGIIFIGVVSPESTAFRYEALQKPEGDAIGHILATAPYADSQYFTYWWGSGWSKGYMPDSEAWQNYLTNYAQKIENPIAITPQ